MAKRKSGFSRVQHNKASATIRAAESLARQIANAYGVNSKQGKAADLARRSLEKLRSAMDDAVFEEDPGQSAPELGSVYYGAASER